MEEERPRKRDRIVKGFSKMLKEDKLKAVSDLIEAKATTETVRS